MSPEDIEELEALRRDVEALGGDPDAVLERSQGAGAYRDVSSNTYDYNDPSAEGAAPGRNSGPMADELRGLPGVVESGPDGMDRVNTGRLSLNNASATGELAREIETLRREVDALGGNPDAVLERAHRGTTVRAQMPTGERMKPSVELGNPYNDQGFGPVATPDPPPKAQPEIRQGTPLEDWWKLSHEERARRIKEQDDRTAAALGADFKLQQNRDANRRETEFRQNQTMRAENVRPGSPAWWEANQNRQVPVDRDERDRQALLIGTETDPDPKLAPYSDEDIENYLRSIENMSSHGEQQGQTVHELRMPTTRRPQNLANEMNRDPRTSNARANIRPEDIERVLRKRQEIRL